MKSTTAVKNIRKYKNKINGKPKRVTTGVDDYGNRFHVVNGKVKHSRSLRENKKAARKLSNTISDPKRPKNVEPTIFRHNDSALRRLRVFNKKWKGKTQQPTHPAKIEYHSNRVASIFNSEPKDIAHAKRRTSIAASAIHGYKRKPKDFTK